MTKAEIVEAVYANVGGFSKKEAAEIVEIVFDSMKDVLAKGDKIKISGFGNFVVRSKNERMGRNPKTGEPMPITARRVLTFRPSQILKTILNPNRSGEQESGNATNEPPVSTPNQGTSSGGGPSNGNPFGGQQF